MKESFVMFGEYEEYFSVLSAQDSHALLMAIFAYENRGESSPLEGMALAFFMVIKNNLDRNRAEYEKKVEARREAGRKGGEAKKANALPSNQENQDQANVANASFANQDQANVADNDNAPGNGNDPEPKEKESGASAPDALPGKPAPDQKPEKELPGEAYKLAALLCELHRDTLDQGFKRTPAQLRIWAADIDKINRIDGRAWSDIEAVIRWCKADSFWRGNIISADKLRAQFDRLFVAMKPGGARDSPRPGAHWDSRGEEPAIAPHLKTDIFKDMPEYDQSKIEF